MMLNRFCSYIEKVFSFSTHLRELRDTRIKGRIPTKTIWGSAFLLFSMHLRSLNYAETQFRISERFKKVIGSHIPSADTIGRVFSLMDPEQFRNLINRIAAQLKRNKVLTEDYPYIFVAIDGHEFFCSKKIHCSSCRVRNIKIDGKEVEEYYHQGVVLSIICKDMAIPLDVEMVAPKEGELTAAKKLVRRVCENYPRLFDVIIGDALYANGPFFNLCHQHKKHVIAVLKGNDRQLLKDSIGLSKLRPPALLEEENKLIEYWDEDNFQDESFKMPLRILRAIEKKKET